MAPRPLPADTAVVLSGGGARAAYQVGFLRCLASRYPDAHIPILTGVSAGAINAAFLASHPGSLEEKVALLSRRWGELTVDRVFRTDLRELISTTARWGLRLVSGGHGHSHTRGLVDTSPLRSFLAEGLRASQDAIPGIDRNIEAGNLDAVAITTTSYSTGQSVTWVQGREMADWDLANRKRIQTRLSVDHVMASAALPVLFPAVELDGHWYGDGGVRLTQPLAPAVRLGAERILVISTRYGRSRAEADRPVIQGYPPPAQVIGVLLNAIFLDQLDADAHRLEAINELVDRIPPEKRNGLRPVRHMVLRPSEDLGQLANDYEIQLPGGFRFMTRGLGTRENRSNDLLSLLMFQPEYLKHLIRMGERDAERRGDEFEEFLFGE